MENEENPTKDMAKLAMIPFLVVLLISAGLIGVLIDGVGRRV